MKPIYLISGLLLFSLHAQAPVPTPLARGNTPGEPHHHLKIENSYIRAYYVEVPPHSETQLHQHDNDYIFVALGDSDVTNAVLGKPEVHLQLKDGEIRFTRGGFAHVARNNSGAPFRNVTIELLRPQGEVHNRCAAVVAGAPLERCGKRENTPLGKPNGGPAFYPLFETNEVWALAWTIQPGAIATATDQLQDALAVGLSETPVEAMAGKQKAQLHAGEMFWLSASGATTFRASASGKKSAQFLVLYFNDSPAPK